MAWAAHLAGPDPLPIMGCPDRDRSPVAAARGGEWGGDSGVFAVAARCEPGRLAVRRAGVRLSPGAAINELLLLLKVLMTIKGRTLLRPGTAAVRSPLDAGWGIAAQRPYLKPESARVLRKRRTATGPRSQRFETEKGVEESVDLHRGDALRAGTARGPNIPTAFGQQALTFGRL